MRLVFLLAYPIYHDGLTTRQWLAHPNQNRWIPALLAEMGHTVELWAGDGENGYHTSELAGFPDYPIRLFRTDAADRRTKYHRSAELVDYARGHPPDAFLIKGLDGGIGTQLLDELLLPDNLPFHLIVGGEYRSPAATRAVSIAYESTYQFEQLSQPTGLRRLWRPPVPADRLVRLPKSVDTDRFRPVRGAPKPYDVVAAARLDLRQKSFAVLGRLAKSLSVAVAGDGPDAAVLRRRHPRVHWAGRVPAADMPAFLHQGRIFLHNGVRERRPTRDFFPRVIAEAAACGLPTLAFEDAIAPDVLPASAGLRISRRGSEAAIAALLADPARLSALGASARAHAETHFGIRSALPALRSMLAKHAPA